MKRKAFFILLFLTMISAAYSQKTEISSRVISSENSGIEHGHVSELNLTHYKMISQEDTIHSSYMSKSSKASVQKTINSTSGNLSTLLTPSELTTVSDLTITGTMDARDFKTIRDKMTALASLNLSGVSITAYNGTEGTDTVGKIKNYEADAIPQFALWNSEKKVTNSLTSITLPLNLILINRYAFLGQSFSSISIPATVKTIDLSAFYSCKSLTSISITGNGETAISANAFRSCTALTSATIGSGVKSIGDRVFQDCSKLTTITISSGLESVGNWMFWNCTSLVSINVNDVNQKFSSLDGVLFDKNKTTLLQFPQAKQTTYSIPSGVTKIGIGAFGSDSKLTSISFSNTVTNIGDWAFEACTGLSSVTIPEKITNIGVAAFYGCSNLTTVNFNAVNCITMGSLDYPAFYTSGLTTVKIGDSVIAIPAWAFAYATKLTSVTLGNNLEAIGQGAFVNCVKLASVLLPASLIAISDDAFNTCSSLTSITIPNNVTSVGLWAFNKCTSLNTVNFNAINCSTVGSYNYPAFYNCGALTLNIGDAVISIPSYAFYNFNSISSLTIGAGVTSIGNSAFSKCINLKIVNFNAVNCTYMGTGTLTTAFPYCDAFTTLYIGKEVTNIPDNAFDFCKGLSSVTIGENVKSIGKGAFQYCISINSISIPNSVTSIGDYAFYRNDALASVSLGKNVSNIGKEAFSYDNLLSELTSLNPVPPTLGETVFEGVPVSTCVLKVPAEKINAYQSANQWKDFTKIVGLEPSATTDQNNTTSRIMYNPTTKMLYIDGINNSAEVSVYHMNGKLMSYKILHAGQSLSTEFLSKGIYVIKAVVNNKVQIQKIEL